MDPQSISFLTSPADQPALPLYLMEYPTGFSFSAAQTANFTLWENLGKLLSLPESQSSLVAQA